MRRTVVFLPVWKSDRFSRTKYVAAASKGELYKCEVKVLSVTEPYDPDNGSGRWRKKRSAADPDSPIAGAQHCPAKL